MNEQPRFIRDFSKKESPEERSQLAQEIREKRKKHFEDKDAVEKKEQEKSEIVKQLEVLRDQVEDHNSASFFIKIKDFFAIKKIKGELNAQLGKQSQIEDELAEVMPGRQDLEETRLMVADFYAKEKKKWAEMPYSREDIAQNFTEDHLSSLSMEDYVTLLQRFPGEMLTHVTRHGVRDHANLGNHQKGLGEHSDTLNVVLAKKELRSAVGIALQENTKEQAIANFLKFDDCPNRNAALGRIHVHLDAAVTGDPHAFADSSAIHLATEEVADSFYGSESGNEIFFAFPSAMIASQYEFSGNLSSTSSNNDQFIWPDIEKGLPLDAGFAFIPQDAKVDAESGSKYYLDQNKEIQLSEGIKEILLARFGEKPGFVQDLVRKAEEADGLDSAEQIEKIKEVFRDYGIKNTDSAKCLADKELRKKLVNIWGAKNEKKEYEKILTKHFQENELNPYRLAENTIPSSEYWENYFQQHPESKPKHIVYYAGGDPTKALVDWKLKNKISKRSEKSNMGFAENEVAKGIKNKDKTQRRFVSIAQNLVDKYFPSTDEVPSYNWSWNN
ncbi:MAG: hypothetical protein WC848_03635 [Parcubacteria group bacterium]|jgi:hypothetical protein